VVQKEGHSAVFKSVVKINKKVGDFFLSKPNPKESLPQAIARSRL